MGWYYHPWWNRKETINRELATNRLLIRPRGELVEIRTLKKCYRGAAWSGTLWAVHEFINWKTGETDKWIGCYMMHYRCGQWGYKPMEESMGPGIYSCPISYLRMVPMPSNDIARRWRQNVIERYFEKENKRFIKKLLKKRQQIVDTIL